MLMAAEDADFTALAAGGPVRGIAVAEGGVAPPPVLEMLRNLAARMRPGCDPAAWLIVEDGEVVGLCSVTAGPDLHGVIDIGYGVAETRQGRGAAGRAVGDVLAWARSRPELSAVTAETSIHNRPSQRVLERNGFVRTG